MLHIRHLYLSPGHNYFGHHEQEPSQHPMLEVPTVRCFAGRGLEGDRFLDYKENYKGQITFFAWEVYAELCAALGLREHSPAALRRNAITEGVDLNELIGAKFEIQGVRFEGMQECKPCYWMDRACAPGAEAFLQGRGGLRARILTDGTLHSD